MKYMNYTNGSSLIMGDLRICIASSLDLKPQMYGKGMFYLASSRRKNFSKVKPTILNSIRSTTTNVLFINLCTVVVIHNDIHISTTNVTGGGGHRNSKT